MGRLTATTQLVIGVALIVVLAALIVALVIMPQFAKASDLDAQIGQSEGDLVTAQALVARRQSAKAQSAANEVELMRIANRMPDSPQLPSLIIELQDLANAADLEFVQVAVGDVTEATTPEGAPAGYSVLEMTALLRGDWVNLVDYSHRLHKLDRGIRVTNTVFTYIAETDEEPEYVEATFTLHAYVMGVIAQAPPAPGAPSTETTTTP